MSSYLKSLLGFFRGFPYPFERTEGVQQRRRRSRRVRGPATTKKRRRRWWSCQRTATRHSASIAVSRGPHRRRLPFPCGRILRTWSHTVGTQRWRKINERLHGIRFFYGSLFEDRALLKDVLLDFSLYRLLQPSSQTTPSSCPSPGRITRTKGGSWQSSTRMRTSSTTRKEGVGEEGRWCTHATNCTSWEVVDRSWTNSSLTSIPSRCRWSSRRSTWCPPTQSAWLWPTLWGSISCPSATSPREHSFSTSGGSSEEKRQKS